MLERQLIERSVIALQAPIILFPGVLHIDELGIQHTLRHRIQYGRVAGRQKRTLFTGG